MQRLRRDETLRGLDLQEGPATRRELLQGLQPDRISRPHQTTTRRPLRIATEECEVLCANCHRVHSRLEGHQTASNRKTTTTPKPRAIAHHDQHSPPHHQPAPPHTHNPTTTRPNSTTHQRQTHHPNQERPMLGFYSHSGCNYREIRPPIIFITSTYVYKCRSEPYYQAQECSSDVLSTPAHVHHVHL